MTVLMSSRRKVVVNAIENLSLKIVSTSKNSIQVYPIVRRGVGILGFDYPICGLQMGRGGNV